MQASVSDEPVADRGEDLIGHDAELGQWAVAVLAHVEVGRHNRVGSHLGWCVTEEPMSTPYPQ